jgi:hypothetical protein
VQLLDLDGDGANHIVVRGWLDNWTGHYILRVLQAPAKESGGASR